MLEASDRNDVIHRTSVSDQVYDHIKNLILSGSLKEGEKIPESVLSEYFHVSRTPVREAIRKLAEYGLVVIKPWSYAFVASIDQKEARDITVVRLCLERLSLRLYADLATGETLAALRAIANACKEAIRKNDSAAAFEQDGLLHLSIARFTGNAELLNLLQTLSAKLQLVRLRQHLPPQSLAVYYEQHETLLQLIEQKKLKEIDALLEEHILHNLDFA